MTLDPSQLLTAGDVRRLLSTHGLAPRHADGQHFVVDPNTVAKVVRDARVTPDDEVLEIGAGLGSLTLALAQVARRVVAVEVDAGLAAALREVVADRPHVDVVHADALQLDVDALVDGGPARMIANLPYNIATPLVLRTLAGTGVTDLFVMVQRELARRWAARPGDDSYGAVSVKIALAADVEIVARVPPTVFHPTPRVESVTARLTRRADAPPAGRRAEVARVVDTAFAHRRKTLRNTLRGLADRAAVTHACHRAGIDPGARAEELPPAAFVRLTDALPDAVTARIRATPPR